MLKRCFILIPPILGLFYAAPVRAGGVNKDFDIIQITPMVGVEIDKVMSFSMGGSNGTTPNFNMGSATSVAYGALAGVKLGPINLGALLQRSTGIGSSRGLTLDKIYGEFGVIGGVSIFTAALHLDGGLVTMTNPDHSQFHGYGAKLGFAMDIYPIKWFSVGVGADADLQFFMAPGNLHFIGVMGGTIVLRTGVHI